LASFALDAKLKLADRQSFTLSLILVQVAMKFAFSNALPALPYLTTLDWKAYLSIIMLACLLLLQSMLPSIVVIEDDLKDLDRILFLVWLGAIAFFEALFGLMACWFMMVQKRALERRATELFEGEKKIELPCLIKSVSMTEAEMRVTSHERNNRQEWTGLVCLH
jgi:hypothetical protein